MTIANLSPNYAWLSKIDPLPRMVAEGLKLLGTVETPGAKNNPVIMGWRDEVRKVGGVNVDGWTGDNVPWCGLMMAVVAVRAGKAPPRYPLWALNWSGFGQPGNQPCLGDVLTFVRSGGGHVAIYIAEDKAAYHVLGGNQSDKVSITRIDKKRLNSVRRPTVLFAASPAAVPYVVASSGALSINEA